MSTYQTILFDWDGCLAKTLDIWLESYKNTFSELGLFPSVETITQEVFGDWNGPKKVGVKDLDEFTEKLLSRVNQLYPTVELYEGASKTLQVLKNKEKQLALLTSSKRHMVSPALKHHKIEGIFDLILAADDVVKHKPDPEIIYKAINHLDADKGKTIIIGDSKSDLGAAKNAAIHSILFYPRHNQVFYNLPELKKFDPTYLVKNLEDTLKIIN